MTSARVVRPTDLVALVTFDGRVYPNEAHTWERLGTRPAAPHALGRAVEHWLAAATGRHTWVCIRRQSIRGMVSARRRGGRTAWEIDCLITAQSASEGVALALLDQLSAGAARTGAERLFLRLDAASALILPARQAGFVPYATEVLLATGGPPVEAPLLPPGLSLRPRERSDEFALFQLYNRTAPQTVRMIEGANLAEWRAAAERRGGRTGADVVGEREGRIVAWLRTAVTHGAGRLDLVVTPEEWPAIEALAAWGLRDLRDHTPVYAAMPSYAGALVERLAGLGFARAGEYALLAKRLTQTVRVTHAVRPAVKPVATV